MFALPGCKTDLFCNFRCMNDCLLGFADARRKFKVRGFLPIPVKSLAPEQNKNRTEALVQLGFVQQT